MQIPNSLFHYYEKSRQPFLSISETADTQFTEIMDGLSKLPTPENRFDTEDKRNFYLFFRRYTENAIHRQFIAKGGKPILEAPRYMTLGSVSWFMDWYEDPGTLEIPLDAFDESSISFTYPDSMMSMLLAEERYEPFRKYKMPYHGQVYLRSELPQLIAEYGMPDETDEQNIEYGNRIIEAQIWDLEPLSKYIR